MTASQDTKAMPAPAATLPAIGEAVFDKQSNGYHRGQVDDFIRTLRNHLSAAEHRVQQLEHRLMPGAEEMAGDAGRVAEAALTSPQATRMIADLLQLATDEALGMRTQAAQEAARLLADARAEASGIIAAARQQADGMAAGARQQADTVIEGARADAKKLTDSAAARAAAVHEAAGRRLDAMTSLHAETIRRATAIRDTMGKLLENEEQRGSLESEVTRALGAVEAEAGLAARPSVSAQDG